VKICGLTRREDAFAAERAGADYLGFVLSEGFGRSVTPEALPELVAGTTARRVAVLVDEALETASERALLLGASVVQLHGEEPPELLTALRARGGWALWKAVRPRSLEELASEVERYRFVADGILVEGWRDGAVGGVGARLTLDPEAVRDLIPEDLALILAGGLAPASVSGAVRDFRPDVVDVSSGVERALGKKDHALVRAFVESVRSASGAAGSARVEPGKGKPVS